MSEITGALSYVSYHLEVQVPVLTIDGATDGAEDAPRVTVAERVHVPTALVRYRELLWGRQPTTTREQFAALLDDYVRLAILDQLGVEITPLIAGEAPLA
jgi:hypothetical protein